MADDDKKGRGKSHRAEEADAEDPGSEPHAEAAQPPVARTPRGQRWLTTNELEALRGRLQKKFH